MVIATALRPAGGDVEPFQLVFVGFALTRGALERLAAPVHLHISKSGLLDCRNVLCFQQSTANSGGPDGDILSARRRNIFVHDDIGDLQTAAALEHAERFFEDHIFLRGEVDHAI